MSNSGTIEFVDGIPKVERWAAEIEAAEKELKKKFPESTIFIMDKDHVKTHIQAEKIVKKF